MKSAIKHSPIFPALVRRRFHAFCLGAPKTGTTSVARMLQGQYRSEHEPLSARTTEYIRAAYEESTSTAQLQQYLLWRDRELFLEMESSHPMIVFTRLLVDTFPNAKFVLPYRDPKSWFQSITDMRLNKTVFRPDTMTRGPHAKFFRDLHWYYYQRRYPEHRPEEQVLKDLRLYTLDGYFSSWAEQTRTVLEEVPPDRLLVIPLHELSSKPERLASFLGVDVATFDFEASHSHRAPHRHGILDQLDPELVEKKIDLHCRDVMTMISSRLQPSA